MLRRNGPVIKPWSQSWGRKGVYSGKDLFIFEEHLTFSGQILALSKSCYYHIQQLHCILFLSWFHKDLYKCHIHHYNLPKSQITHFQHIQKVLYTVVKAPKSCHITRILCGLHWLTITEHINYKLLSLTYKVFTTTQTSNLHNLISVQPPRSTRSSSLVTLTARPSTSSSLRTTDHSLQHASPCLWNELPTSLHQPHPSLFISDCPFWLLLMISSCWFITVTIHNSFTLSLPAETYLFHKSFPTDSLLASRLSPQTSWLDFSFWASRIFVFSSFCHFCFILWLHAAD